MSHQVSLDNIRVVLVRTHHSGNIGSAARAMKTMGLTNLVLVSPTDFQKDQALQMAMSADDVVINAKHVDSVYEAVSDCAVVIGSTARTRGYDLPMLSPETAARHLLQSAEKQSVALVFGPERMGLHNDDLVHCTHRATIATNPDYSGEVMKKLRRMFSRAQMDQTEMGIMRGVLAAMQKPKNK